jgi:choline/glycine/proline betaine transport protein
MLGRYLRTHTNAPVFISSLAVVLGCVIAGAIFTGATGEIASATQQFITEYFGWFYILGVSFFLVFVVGLLFTRYGRVRLGSDHSRPEFSTWSWFAMLFTAGMGIGLVFYGVAEPIAHYASPPTGEPQSAASYQEAMNLTFFHWGLHPWAIYIVLGLSLGYFAFRRGLPLRPASAFYPLIGERVNGWVGNLIDILAVFGTVFGLATSLGIGATQISAGLDTLFGIAPTTLGQILIIAIITAITTTSVLLGIERGIRRLSVINMWLAAALALFVMVAGPTLFILATLTTSLGYYLQNIIETSLTMFTTDEAAAAWQAGWTLFYWGWWISWAPFVGMFIARVSRGRTIREFIVGTLIAPTAASFVWFSIFGGTALYTELFGEGGLTEAPPETALYSLLATLPVAQVLITLASVIGVVVVVLFFATSADSGSLVVDILTNGGDPQPRWQQRLIWAVLIGAVAAVLLAAGAAAGDPDEALTALQAASIAAGLPFCVVLLVMCVGLWRGLREEGLPALMPDPRRYGGEIGRPSSEGERAAGKPSGAAAPYESRGLDARRAGDER